MPKARIMSVVLMAFGILAEPFPALATSVVAILGEKSITIAADGIVIGTSDTTGEPLRNTMCKIRCVDNLCFAAAGRITDKTSDYSLYRMANEELDRRKTLKESSEHFKTILTPFLPSIAAAQKRTRPDLYAKALKGTPLISYIFAGFDVDGKTLIVNGQASIDANGKALPIDETSRHGTPGPPDLLSFGSNEQINDYLSRHPGWVIATVSDPSDFAEKMIRLEILASERSGRRDVGEPISMVSLSDKQTHFTAVRMGTCQSRQVEKKVTDKTIR